MAKHLLEIDDLSKNDLVKILEMSGQPTGRQLTGKELLYFLRNLPTERVIQWKWQLCNLAVIQ